MRKRARYAIYTVLILVLGMCLVFTGCKKSDNTNITVNNPGTQTTPGTPGTPGEPEQPEVMPVMMGAWVQDTVISLTPNATAVTQLFVQISNPGPTTGTLKVTSDTLIISRETSEIQVNIATSYTDTRHVTIPYMVFAGAKAGTYRVANLYSSLVVNGGIIQTLSTPVYVFFVEDKSESTGFKVFIMGPTSPGFKPLVSQSTLVLWETYQ